MDEFPDYERATKDTAENLQKVAKSLQKLTRLSLPEVDAVVDLVSKIIPAGNVPGMILSGLSRISGNDVQPQKARQDINILFKEVSLFFEQAKFGALFAGPATVIWGYQLLLKLAGKDQESAFPEGIWQFYAEYALREDTARHANETRGFDILLGKNKIHLNEADRLTAWVMASVTCLYQYDSLLASEWYERTALWLLQEATQVDSLYTEWEKQKPYARGADGANYDYPAYRRLKFEQFLKTASSSLSRSAYDKWDKAVKDVLKQALVAYQKQMSILAYLNPSSFGETRIPISLKDACIGIIHNGTYFLLPVCEPGTDQPLDVRTARSQIVKLLSAPPKEPARLRDLALIKRSDLSAVRQKLSSGFQNGLEQLRRAPIIINSDHGAEAMLLSEIRQRERGVGDHALTIFDTGYAFVFDQSHIFFDGGWGAALAEIITNEALSWAVYLNMLSPAPLENAHHYVELQFTREASDEQVIQQAPRVSPEAGAENDKVKVKTCLDLRNYFKQRNDLLNLTINDLLVLYRAIHAVTYRPSVKLASELEAFAKTEPEIASLIERSIVDLGKVNPSLLIPVDASRCFPRDRVYPLNLEVPLVELDLLTLHAESMQMLAASKSKQNKEFYKRFDQLQRQYLATLGGFGTILAKAKNIAVQGESASVGAIKLLAHLPAPLKHLLDKIPTRYEKLNNLLKGTEVLSNLGAIAKSSSLTRFITAKDDNEQKQLAWGIMTDAQGLMKISLRDFRPHVATLQNVGRGDLANLITQDYLDAYAQGLNQFVNEVTQFAVARPRHIADTGNQKSS